MGTWLTYQYKITTYNLGVQAWCSDVVSGRAYINIFIHPANLCLLVGVFDPFTFKIMMDMYDPITIFLIVLGLFSEDLFLLLFLLLICCTAGLVVLISLNFCLLGELLIFPSTLNGSLAGWRFLAVGSSLSSLYLLKKNFFY